MKNKPSLPKGTRDFGPIEMARRIFILDTIKKVFLRYGFQQIETPAMEQLSTLTGKYGDEGDQLLFKILNSGDYLKDIDTTTQNSKLLMPLISEKGLRYDLTVPFARYVVMNQHDITFPFRRFQIQPVWRADRPQKGRYREFYQCDADIIGTRSLVCEAEIIQMILEVFSGLSLEAFTIKMNHRSILAGIAEVIEAPDKMGELCIILDKLDKIGQDKVMAELAERGFNDGVLSKLEPFFQLETHTWKERLDELKTLFTNSMEGLKGVREVEEILSLASGLDFEGANFDFDPLLARGLTYYTGAIFEVKAKGVSIGSICGGGRYDNLTGVFGLEDVSGVGISFGVDRIYDVMEELEIFPVQVSSGTKLLIAHFDKDSFKFAIRLLGRVRKGGIAAEIYPEDAKMKKQLGYADKKQIPYVVIIGPEEIQSGAFTFKNMQSGDQSKMDVSEIIEKLKEETDE